MYKALIQTAVPVHNNSEIWKMKIPLKTKVFAWYLLEVYFLPKIILQSGIGRKVKSVSSVIMTRI